MRRPWWTWIQKARNYDQGFWSFWCWWWSRILVMKMMVKDKALTEVDGGYKYIGSNSKQILEQAWRRWSRWWLERVWTRGSRHEYSKKQLPGLIGREAPLRGDDDCNDGGFILDNWTDPLSILYGYLIFYACNLICLSMSVHQSVRSKRRTPWFVTLTCEDSGG